MPYFPNYVGVAPGTTTMQLGGLGVCPPGHYGSEIMLPGAVMVPSPASGATATSVTIDPYATESRLSGAMPRLGGRLGALTAIRWDLVALALGLGFAGTIGYAFYRKRSR